MGITTIRGDRLITAGDDQVRSNVAVEIQGGQVTGLKPSPVERCDWEFPGCTVLPGLIDVHVHITLPGDGQSYEHVASTNSDELMAIRALRNCAVHLASGVTTVRDNGGRNRVTFVVREAMRQGLFVGPRLLLSGRPITPTGGHFHWCNGVADGADQIRAAVRRLVNEGADHIKIMASGGGTAGTDPTRACYSVEEMHTAVLTAHDLGKLTTAHCRATESIARAVEADLDCIEHAEFVSHDGTIRYDEQVARAMADSGTWISPTLLAGAHQHIFTLRKFADERNLTEAETRRLADLEDHLERRLETLGRLLALGLGPRLVSGTDAGPGFTQFGTMGLHLELMVRGGMTPMDSILSGTRYAADACGVSSIGVIAEGKRADILVVRGDPIANIAAISDVVAVFKDGEPVHVDHAKMAELSSTASAGRN